MEIAVCDDEQIIRNQIINFLERQETDCSIKSYQTGEELLATGKTFDIIFLDIQMGGMNGIEVARLVREKKKDTIIVFITGIKEYVFEAFDVSAFHYLLKPIVEKKFEEVFVRAMTAIEKLKEQRKEKLFIKTRNRSITIEQKDILYIESMARKVNIHTKDEVLEIYAAMRQLEEQLGKSFYRSHRSYLVNMDYITEYGIDYIRINNGETIYLAKEKYQDFVKKYMRYLRNGGISCV